MGPALPVSFKVPPAGRSPVISNGKDEVNEKFVTLIFTALYTRCGSEESARETVKRPSLTLSLATDRLGSAVDAELEPSAFGGLAGVGFPEGAGAGVPAPEGAAPRLEKFHLSPLADFTR